MTAEWFAPFGRPGRARVSGGELAFVDAGEGEPVVFLHGFPTWSYLWRAFLPPVVTTGMRAIAVDMLGYGDSSKPADARLDVRAQAGYVRELLQQLGVGSYAVVGHDLGGAVAQLLALDGDAVRTMVLLDAAAFDAWPIEGVRMLQDATPEQATEGFVGSVIDLTLELGMGHGERLTDELRAAYRRPFAGEEGAAAYFRAVRAIDGVGLAGREDELAALEIPTMLLWGEDDPYLGSELGERLNDLMDGSALGLLPGCSHFLPEDAPETVAPIVAEYLRARYAGIPHGHAAPSGPLPIELRPFTPEER